MLMACRRWRSSRSETPPDLLFMPALLLTTHDACTRYDALLLDTCVLIDEFQSAQLKVTAPGPHAALVDCLLAAESLAYGYPFVTRKVKHFQEVSEVV
jgi:hypothetical protein